MSYSENRNQDLYWNRAHYNPNEFGMQDELKFQTVDHYEGVGDMHYTSPEDNFNRDSQLYPPNIAAPGTDYKMEEPPLLEELGIDTDQIILKSVAVLNPFNNSLTPDINAFIHDTDLAGPISFCVTMAACILLSGGKAHFGYVYGLAVTGCVLMYVLLNLMTTTHEVSLATVASVLGYSLLPVVILSALGIFFSLRNLPGFFLSLVAVMICSVSASRFFVTILGDVNQRYLIAYPCALLYAVFDLIAVF